MKTALIPHTLRLVAVATTLTLAAGCGGSDSTASSTPSTDAAGSASTAAGPADTSTADTSTADTGPAPTADALTVESGFSTGLSSLGTRFTSVGAVVTNTSDQTACGVQVEFTILDAKGTALETQTRTVHAAAPKAAVPVVPNAMGGGKPDEPTKLDVKVVGVDSFATGATCGTAATPTVALTTTAVTLDADLKYIRGTVNNPTDAPTASTAVDCILRAADGTIAGGDKKTIVDPIAPGADVAFKLRLLWAPPTATAAECNATA